MTIRSSLLALALAPVLSAVPVSADVQLSVRDGHVWLRATNATLREILAEWATIGQVRIINGEQLTGGPVTLLLMDVTEGQALDVLLRSVAVYIVAQRPTAVPNAAQFDRILILPTSTAPRAAASPASPAISQPSPFTPPPQLTQPSQIVTPEALRFIVPQVPDGEDSCGPVPPPPFGPQLTPVPAPAQPTKTVPPGVNVPGMIVPPPPPPGQIVQPQ